jgi:hypothetical protein
MRTLPVKRSVRYGIRIGLLLVLGLAVGCKGPPPSRLKFAEGMAKANRDLAKAARAFRKSLDSLKDSKGQQASSADLESRLADCKKVLEGIKSDYEDPVLPRDCNQAENLLTAYRNYLKEQDKILDEMDLIVKDVKNNAGGGAIQAKLTRIKTLEEAALKPLSEAQTKYAEEKEDAKFSLEQ